MLDDTSQAWLNALTNNDTTEADRLGAVLDAADTLDRRQRDNDRLADAARRYAGAGIAVFPIRPGGKAPLTAHGFKDATTDPDQITEWWTATPDANIGIPTGGLFDVIDVDGLEGIASIYNGTPCIADSLDILGIALTSRPGGRHLYVPRTDLGNKTAIWPGVDYRSVGGYVVAPPSIGANGRHYMWMRPLTLTQQTAAA